MLDKLKQVKPQIRQLSKDNPFSEVILGYNKFEAIEEASRCLNCKNAPCVQGCPLHNNIPGFIMAIKNDDLNMASDILEVTSGFSNICSRVCYSENQCEKHCTRGIKGESIAINYLERYVTSQPLKIIHDNCITGKVAVIGSGPTGLGAAYELAKVGISVTVFEKNPGLGGWLSYGIPQYRLPSKEVERIYDKLLSMNVKFVFDYHLDDLTEFSKLVVQFDYVYLAVGLNCANELGIPGENNSKVIVWKDFLADQLVFKDAFEGKDIIVVGGGNVAIDCARSAIRLNPNSVKIVYRRSVQEMPANQNEINDALNEGVEIIELRSPLRIDDAQKLNFIADVMKLGEIDSSGRRKPVSTGEQNVFVADYIISAIGSKLDDNPIYKEFASNRNLISVDEKGQTTNEKVFAGGDSVTGAKTVVEAIAFGKKVAKSIIDKLKS